MKIYELLNMIEPSVPVTLFDTSSKTIRGMFTRTTVGELLKMPRGCDFIIDSVDIKDWEWKSSAIAVCTELRITY